MYKQVKRNLNMTIDEAKRVRIVDFLAQLGHRAQYMKSEQYWYLSPLRKEVTPSFKVNDRLNEWYDFGEATGGDLVELGKYLCETKSVSEALAYIERHVNGVSLPKTRTLPATFSTRGSRHEKSDYRAAATPRTVLISPFTYD